MKDVQGRFGRVLSIDPRSRRVAWAYFQDGHLEDCSVPAFRERRAAARSGTMIAHFVRVLDQLSPHAIVVPRIRGGGVRSRGADSARFIRAIVKEAVGRGIAVHVISSDSVIRSVSAFRPEIVRNKEDLHRFILDRFPELTAMAPTPRKMIWEPEAYYTPLFNAVAMYLAFAHRLGPTADA